MVRKRFEDSFEELREQSNRLAATDRSPDNFDEIVKQRVKLDRLRKKATRERKRIVTRHEPPATDVVHDSPHLSTFGKVAAGISVGLLVVLGIFVIKTVGHFTDQFPLVIVSVTETITTEPRCRWNIEASVRNDSDSVVEILGMETVLGRDIKAVFIEELPRISPGETATLRGLTSLGGIDPCPTVDQLDHRDLTIRFDEGSGLLSRFPDGFRVSTGF